MSNVDPNTPVDMNPKQLYRLEGVTEVYTSTSTSRPGLKHYTFVFADGHVECTCEGWRHQRKCWHINALPETEEADFDVNL